MLTAITCKAHAVSGAVSALENQVGRSRQCSLITNAQRHTTTNNTMETKAQMLRHKSELQFCSEWTWHGQKYLLLHFIFHLSVLHCSTVTGLWPHLNETAAARLSLSIVYPGPCQFPYYAMQCIIYAISQWQNKEPCLLVLQLGHATRVKS